MTAPARIDQWTPALHRGDAIGDSTLLMRNAFRSWGYAADVYALSVDEALEGEAQPFTAWRPGSLDDIVILHYALPSPLTPALRQHRGRRVLIHHNITPPEFFREYDPEMVRICATGRAELATLSDHVELALGDSEFNRRELQAAGFRRTGILPIYLDFDRYRQPANPALQRSLEDGRVNVLFVGRVVPNKRHDDLIRVASYWKRFISPNLRLVLVGKLPRRQTGHGHHLPRHYFDALQAFFYEEGFTPEEIVFTEHVDHDDLLAYYRAADLFLSMSEHEGFGVPLVEAMLMGVPVLAYGGTAIGDVLGDAGVQVKEKSIPEIAELAHRLATNGPLRQSVLARQRERLRAFSPAVIEATLKTHLESCAATDPIRSL